MEQEIITYESSIVEENWETHNFHTEYNQHELERLGLTVDMVKTFRLTLDGEILGELFFVDDFPRDKLTRELERFGMGSHVPNEHNSYVIGMLVGNNKRGKMVRGKPIHFQLTDLYFERCRSEQREVYQLGFTKKASIVLYNHLERLARSGGLVLSPKVRY